MARLRGSSKSAVDSQNHFLLTYLGGSHFSKDIIFVVSDGEAEGLQAWLKAYHGNEENTYGRYLLQFFSHGTILSQDERF